MQYAKLGRTGIDISRITHGCMELGGGPNPDIVWAVEAEEVNARLINTALANGVNLFDTAEGYGKGLSEEITGRALKGRRESCLVATKVSREHLNPDDVAFSLEGSLKRLGMDYVDLYYIHWPNDAIPIQKTMGKLMQLKSQGLIRAIGVSNFSINQLKEAIQYGEISALQQEYNLLARDIEGEILPFCAANSISVLTYNSIAKGVLSGAFHLYGAKLSPEDFRNKKPLFQPENLKKEQALIALLKEIADRRNATLSQVAIAWLLSNPGVTSAIVGTQNEKHFVDNLKAVNLALTEQELRDLSDASLLTIKALKEP